VRRVDWVQVKGVLDKEEKDRVVRECVMVEEKPDKIVVGGPGNSLFRHGKEGERGFCPERVVNIVKGKGGEVEKVQVKFHMTDPVKISMGERNMLVDRTVELVQELVVLYPECEVIYMTMFPRHVNRCCKQSGHMTEDDSYMVSGFRRGVDNDVREELDAAGSKVRHVQWWEMMGWDEEGTLESLRKKKVVCEDGVHLTKKANSFAAVSLCHRLADVRLWGGVRRPEDEDGRSKRSCLSRTGSVL